MQVDSAEDCVRDARAATTQLPREGALSPNTRIRTPRALAPYVRTSDAHKMLDGPNGHMPNSPRDMVSYNYGYRPHFRDLSEDSGYNTLSTDDLDESKNTTGRHNVISPDLGPLPECVSPLPPSEDLEAHQDHQPSQQSRKKTAGSANTRDASISPLDEQRPVQLPPQKRRSSLPALDVSGRGAPYNAIRATPRSALNSPVLGQLSQSQTSWLAEVDIPSARIGTPRFTDRGTLYLQSIYSPSALNTPTPRSARSTTFDSALSRDRSEDKIHVSQRIKNARNTLLAPTPTFAINAHVYDAFVADGDNPVYVRYDHDYHLLAATPARIVMEIAHDRFLDYQLLSNFFLTYRSFMSPSTLLSYLAARLRWALFSPDHGRIVRVRAFVAIRHWILNYFLDDFEPDIHLRSQFCELINALTHDLHCRHGKNFDYGDLQVIGELKKAWTRTCDVVWPPRVKLSANTMRQHNIRPGGHPHERPEKQDFRLYRALHDTATPHTKTGDHPTHDHSSSRIRPSVELDELAKIAADTAKLSPDAERRMRHTSITPTSCSLPAWSRFIMGAIKPNSKSARLRRPKSQSGLSTSRRITVKRTVSRRPSRAPAPLSRRRSSHGNNHLAVFTRGALVNGILLSPTSADVKQLFVSSAASTSLFVTESNGKPRNLPTRARDPRRIAQLIRKDELSLRSIHAYQSALHPASHAVSVRNARTSPQVSESPIIASATAKQNARTSDTDIEALRALQNRMTTGSRSILIVDDTGPKHSFDLHEHLVPNDRMGLREIPQRPSIELSRYTDLSWPKPPERFSTYVPPFSGVQTFTSARRSSTGDLNFDLARASSRAVCDQDIRDQGSMLFSRSPARPTPSAITKMSSLRLMSIHNSLHDMRPSFQARTADFTTMTASGQVDDGGVESTLAKLEGSVASPASSRSTIDEEDPVIDLDVILPDMSEQPELKGLNLLLPDTSPHLEDTPMGGFGISDNIDSVSPDSTVQDSSLSRYGALSEPMHTSGLSIPFKQAPMQHDPTEHVIDGLNPASTRGHERNTSASTINTTASSFLLDPNETFNDDGDGLLENKDITSDRLQEKSLLKSLAEKKLADAHTASHISNAQSFFFDIEEEVEDDADEQFEGMSRVTPMRREGETLLANFSAPLSPPPLTPLPDLPASAFFSRLPPRETDGAADANGVFKADAKIPETSQSPLRTVVDADDGSSTLLTRTSAPKISRPANESMRASMMGAQHTAFVLGYSAEVLAQHFTVIEQDVLTEVDWKDLVDMQWTQKPEVIRDWSSHLVMSGQSGIDMVTARFNLVVKWAISEILLTTDVRVRARTIDRYIEIAVACRRIGNYATCCQLTNALLSTAVRNLTLTWELVGTGLLKMLLDLAALAALIQVDGSQADLRSEMESRALEHESSNTKHREHKGKEDLDMALRGACIPVLRVYLDDLTIIAQSPALIEPTDITPAEPLVNFDRFQAAARTVKGVLRLLDASSLYRLRCDKDIVARCLWLSALDDAEITRVSTDLAHEENWQEQ